MWTCPVCAQTCTGYYCNQCGFDQSTDFENFPTLQAITAPKAAISKLRKSRSAGTMPATCKCCGSTVTGNSCGYCGFTALPGQPPSGSLLQSAAIYADRLVKSLTNFSIVAYRYAWEPQRSRLELQAEEIVPLGNATAFFPNIFWASKEFGQLRNGTGTEITFDLTYHYNGRKKVIPCTIPTVKCDNFWRVGIALDKSLHIKLYLGSGSNFIESAPIALDLT